MRIGISTHPIPDPHLPTPLAAERPMLAIKAQALISGEPAWASQGDHGNSRHMSMALPRYCDSVVTFALEQDPTNDRIFVYGLTLDLRLRDTQATDGQVHRRPYALLHDQLWAELLARVTTRSTEPLEALVDRVFVDPRVDSIIAEQSKITPEQIRERRLLRVKKMLELMTLLRREGNMQIECDPEHHDHAWIKADIGDYNTGTDDLTERKLVRRLIRHGVAMVELVALYEDLVVGTGSTLDSKTGKTRHYLIRPSSGIFFWSQDQLIHVQALLERHLTYLMTGSDIYREFRLLLELIAPLESGVQKHYQNRKVFDLRRFVETTVGLPQIINYTWHETAHTMLSHHPIFERRYWSPHYNYMLFVMWHEALDQGGLSETRRMVDEAITKAKVIGQLVRLFQGRARHHGVISHHSYALQTRQIFATPPSQNHHFFARAWAQYARLDATVQEQVAVDQRLTFPLAAIGKLAAAHISNLTYTSDQKEVLIDFTLTGLSANVKFKPGDFVYLIHETRRDIKPHEWGRDTIVLNSMTWERAIEGYAVSAVAYSHSERSPATLVEFPSLDPTGWYLYNSPVDVWTNRLNRVLGIRNIGTSWLGTRRALLMNLMPGDETLPAPTQMAFDVAECAMFAPELLPSSPHKNLPLLTPAHPTPDASQQRAIRQAFEHPMSCILGPPGTGKSQTMTGLIDEFLCRHPEGPLKILVSASSYEPMSVVLDKLQAHRDQNGNPTLAAQIAKVWLHSSSRQAPEQPDIYDFCLDGDKMLLNQEQIQRRKASRLHKGEKWRMEDSLPDRFILFGVPHQLTQLVKRDSKGQDRFLHLDHFAFDLIVVDEASQMPVDQACALLPLIHRAHLHLAPLNRSRPGEPILDHKVVEVMHTEALLDEQGAPFPPERLTRIVFVGDHNQLPPVQKIEPPRKLLPILQSAFAYFQQHLNIPSVQLQTNYRSRQEIVDYTNSLNLYEQEIIAYFADHPGIPTLPPSLPAALAWLEQTLGREHVVSAIVHDQQFDTAISELEAMLMVQVVFTMYWQINPTDAHRERLFWSRDIGIVSPHNAQGRLITRMLYDTMLQSGSHLGPQELMEALSETTYSVEKFQGSARTFIIASMGLSSIDQIKAEETFIYDLNRLNVLTSRAVQKMLLICSKNLLDHTPLARHMVGPAARLRDYVFRYCNTEDAIDFKGHTLQRRWHDLSKPSEPQASHPVRRTKPSGAQDKLDDIMKGLSPEDLAELKKRLQ